MKPGSDDILWLATVKIEFPYVLLNPIEAVSIGEILVVTVETNREDGTHIFITVEGSVELTPQVTTVENGTFSARFDTSDAVAGTYVVTADGGEGHTDELWIVIVPIPSVTISTDKYEYTTGERMFTNMTIANPTEEMQPVYLA